MFLTFNETRVMLALLATHRLLKGKNINVFDF